MPKLRKISPPSMPDHQVLLSFVNDDDALWFHQWWNDDGGLEAFIKYTEEQREETP